MAAAELLRRRTAGRAKAMKTSMGGRHGQGQGLGAAEGKRLGHQFADDYVEVGDEGEAEDDGGDVRIGVAWARVRAER